MQFPVPQFTDVEDKIFGPLSLKQFGIVFGAGIVVFLGYSSTKSVLVAVFLFMLFGVPAIALAFGKINGRPVYNTIGMFMRFFSSPKVLVFHKEASHLPSASKLKDADLKEEKAPEEAPVQDTQAHLREVQAMLQTTMTKEKETLSKLRNH